MRIHLLKNIMFNTIFTELHLQLRESLALSSPSAQFSANPALSKYHTLNT